MGGDYSRTSFDPQRNYGRVGMQQGHPTTDADWNELAAIFERSERARTLDTLGRAVVPKETPTGFEIRLAPGPKLMIGRGRMYVDGHLAENHGGIGTGAQRPVFDRARLDPDGKQTSVLDEMISTLPNDFIAFTAQPYLPKPPALPVTPGPHIAFLKVWTREVTAVKDVRLLEPALGGIDTATRWQTVWQVGLLADVGAGASCGAHLSKWDAMIAPSPARLTTATLTVEDPDDPCLIPPGGGYRGLENHYYRVEIHAGGALGAGRFKFSRDNGSIAARIESIMAPNRVRVRSVGRDLILRVAVGDWVEFTDDLREFAGASGDMRRITAISDSNEIELNGPLSPDLIPAAPDSTGARNSRMIKWDETGKVRFADGSLCVDLDAVGSDGLIPVPTGGQKIVLEAGITVAFTTESAGGVLRPLDHWCFAARTEGAQIEILDAAPPLGIHHHYARLAVVTFPSTVSDCRIFWPPAEECGCTVCVSAEGHNSGRFTIQDAIQDLPAAGGTVCLGPGDFILGATPVVIGNRESVRLRGHGFGSELAYAGPGGAIRVRDSSDIRVSDLAVTVASAPAGGPDRIESAAVHIANGAHVTVNRTRLRVASGEGGNDFGIALGGWVIDVTIADNLIEAVTGIGSKGEVEATGQETATIVYDLRVIDNLIGSPGTGVMLEGSVFHLGAVQIEANTIFAGHAGISATGVGLGVPGGAGESPAENWSATGLWIAANSISFARGGSGVASGILDLRVLDNDIVAREDSRGIATGSCVRLVGGGMPLVPADAQIVGNRLGNVDGYAISIEASQASLLIKRNVMHDCEQGAVTVGPNVSIRSLSFDNNLIEHVATREAPGLRVAVKLSGVADARILGNSLRGVGSTAAGSVHCVGFDINGAASLDLSHNLITDIGPGAPNAFAIGVYIHGAILACAVTANHIFDAPNARTQGTSSWCAIAIQGQSIGQTAAATTGAPSQPAGTNFAAFGAAGAALAPSASGMPAHFVVGNTVFTLGTNRIWPFAPVRETQIRIAGNIISATNPNSVFPLVIVGAGGGACTFNDNQCALLAPGRAPTLVAITVPRIVAANNVVRRQSDKDAMTLVGGSIGPKPTVTALGNITFGNIRVNNGPLPAPFAPLNILSS